MRYNYVSNSFKIIAARNDQLVPFMADAMANKTIDQNIKRNIIALINFCNGQIF